MFYLAGGFGRHLNIESSKRIGLIPNIAGSKILQVGNAAIEGACIALHSRSKRAELESLVKRVTHCGSKRTKTFLISLSKAASSARWKLQPRRHSPMFELTETNPPLAVPDAEYQRLLGYPKNHVPAGRSRELADAARKWFSENGRPWIYAREIGTLELRDETLRIGGSEFSSRKLHDLFAGAPAHRAVLVAVSAGKECEERARQLWQESKPDEYFFMEIFGSAVVEHLVTVANGRICGWADANVMAALPHYSPGYSGWDIADQVKLWNLIKKTSGGGFPGELDVLESGMLRPKKSLLALVGITRNLEMARRSARLIPCENCSLPGCQYRRAPYLNALPQFEDIHRLQNSRYDGASAAHKPAPLTRNAKYSVNPRALQKWSQERLRLNFLPDGRWRRIFTTKARRARTWAARWNLITASNSEPPMTITKSLRRVACHRPATPGTRNSANI